jgi:hypothetical protein
LRKTRLSGAEKRILEQFDQKQFRRIGRRAEARARCDWIFGYQPPSSRDRVPPFPPIKSAIAAWLLVPSPCGPLCRACLLLVSDLCDREPGANRDYTKDGMPWIAWQA